MKDWIVFIIRIFIGGMFVYLGWTKTQDPVSFLKTIREFDLLQAPWQMNIVAAWLPWFEVWCGLLLLLGVGIRVSAGSVAALLLGFTGMILWRALQVHSAGNIAFCEIQFDCGCGTGEVVVCHKLIQNVILSLASFWIAFVNPHKLALWPSIRIPISPVAVKQSGSDSVT